MTLLSSLSGLSKCISLIVTSSATDKKLEIDKKSRNLQKSRNLTQNLQKISKLNLELKKSQK